jgi:hypothetical protein
LTAPAATGLSSGWLLTAALCIGGERESDSDRDRCNDHSFLKRHSILPNFG